MGLVYDICAEPGGVSLGYARRSGNGEGASALQKSAVRRGASPSYLPRHFSGEEILKLLNRCREELTSFHHIFMHPVITYYQPTRKEEALAMNGKQMFDYAIRIHIWGDTYGGGRKFTVKALKFSGEHPGRGSQLKFEANYHLLIFIFDIF
jgi:hypothetical protein